MKLDKTSGEFYKAIREAWHLHEFTDGKIDEVTLGAALVAALDLEFKEPEEPELAKRLASTPGGSVVAEHARGGHRNLTPAEAREAAARYNAWGELLYQLEGMKRGVINVEEATRRVRASLESERERLQ